MAVYPFSQGNTNDPTLDAVAVELEAMQAIAKALAGIRDPHVRQRVLQWANERFNLGPTPQPPAGRPVVTDTDVDESSLDVEPLYDFFNAPRPATQSHSSQATPAPVAIAAAVVPARELRAVRDAREPREDAALDTMVKGFASELQRLAVEWQTT